MTAFDTVHDRLDVAVGALAKAHIACRDHYNTKPIHQMIVADPKGEALGNAEHDALIKVVAAFHYAEQVAASGYSGESTLRFLERERQEADNADVLTSNRDPAEGLTRLEQLGTLYSEEKESVRAKGKP